MGTSTLLVVTGFTIIITTMLISSNEQTIALTVRATERYKQVIGSIGATSGANIALAKVAEDHEWRAGLPSISFNGGNFSVTVVDTFVNPDSLIALTSTGSYGNTQKTIQVMVGLWETAAGRRVNLPWGRAGFDFNLLNDDGKTIMKRAIEWAATPSGGGPPGDKLLLVVVNPGALTPQEAMKKALIESWGYTVTLIDDDASEAAFDAASATVDVAYAAEEIYASILSTKLKDATIGFVSEEWKLATDYGYASVEGSFDDSVIDIADNTHYITSLFSVGPLTILTSSSELHTGEGTFGGGVQVLGEAPSSSAGALLAIDTGGELYCDGCETLTVMSWKEL